ncbi:MAG: branched-chain amino acid ABC transporter permease [Betaproteobacteria bacterium]|nr:branched-chain amino acid ABC transporter permease [Betaproteobacteria bacterium]
MSAAHWRRAMNRGAGQAQPLRDRFVVAASASSSVLHDRSLQGARGPGAFGGATTVGQPSFGFWQALMRALGMLRLRHLAALLLLLAFPWIGNDFLTYQIGAQALALGLITLSLTFLGGYGGMISLAQMSIAGVAGYTVAILGASGAEISLGWPWWAAVAFGLGFAVLSASFVGWLSVRTEGIYTIMITLAFGVAFYYLALQNYSLFNGFQGFQRVHAPEVFGVSFRKPLPFYFLCLACALAAYLLVKWTIRTPFGIALQGVRDNPRRMAALGFDVTAHRVAAYGLAGLLAGLGGVLLVWYNGLITPGSINTGWLINVLVMAVLGGMSHPLGAFLGALVFVLLQTFAIDLFDRERFNLVIGAVFLLIVLFSPDGLLGLWSGLRKRMTK